MAARGLATTGGVIDAGYRGEILILMTNLGDAPVVLKSGEKIAQMIPVPVLTGVVEEVEALEDSARAERASEALGGSGRGAIPPQRQKQRRREGGGIRWGGKPGGAFAITFAAGWNRRAGKGRILITILLFSCRGRLRGFRNQARTNGAQAPVSDDYAMIEAFRLALQSLWANKLRSLLTLIGVIIGVSSVITVVTLTNGAKKFVTSKINTYGASTITISKMPQTL